MVENRPYLNFIAHAILIIGIVIITFPLWIAFVASTLPNEEILSSRVSLIPGNKLIENYKTILVDGFNKEQNTPVFLMMWNSLVMAISITVGKIVISLMAAFAIVYFRFPFRKLCFWLIFITLMLPVEVRILPTFKVVADLNMLNSYWGLTIPLIASATATFLFRQFFLTVPNELLEAARIDGTKPTRFLFDILIPLSKTNIAALFVILFIYGWNQYLWPLLITTEENFYTVVMGIQRMVTAAQEEPRWHLVMATTILALLPPVVVILSMQRFFVKGLIDTEK